MVGMDIVLDLLREKRSLYKCQLVRKLLFFQLSILELLKNLIEVIRLDVAVSLDCV